MAKLPQQVKVGGINYKVSMVDSSNDFFGRHNGSLSTIEICKGHSKDQERATAIHELIHAIIHERGLTNMFTGTSEENFISVFEGGLYALLRDNPKLVQYLMEKS